MKRFLAFSTLFVATAAYANLGVGDGEYPTQCDIDGNGIFATTSDFGVFFQAMNGSPANDFIARASDMNHDGRVTVQDFGVLYNECIALGR